MGAVQVLRVAVLTVAGPAIAGALAGPARAGEPIAIVDARTGDPTAEAAERADLALALRDVDGLTPIDDARAVALTGADDTTDGPLADLALAQTRERFGALDCAGVREPAQRAVQLLAGREAAGIDETVRLRAAWSYLLLCADKDGARVPAQGFADRLRTLGGSPAIPAELWARYPVIDTGSELALTDLVIEDPPEAAANGGSIAGAAVWLDHRRVGTAPMTLAVPSGGHVLAMARGDERAGLVMLVGDPGKLTVSIGLTSYAAAQPELAAQVRRWQAGAPVKAPDVGALLDRAGARFAIVVEGDHHASVWAREQPGGAPADVVFAGELDQPAKLAAAVRDTLAAWERAPSPDVPLITETDLAVAEVSRSHKRETPWWVYVAIGGAAVAGGVTIWAMDAGDNRQRIELTFP
ncbi:MAG TPA: hypothetical protein VHE35_23220 [Kofleriaceae bacterium]|nr:hypothetical protein [Kofleriaceae bacterium]